ncbi:MAG: hypothetical protein ACE360_15495 [Hyphomicrobiales bacterium]
MANRPQPSARLNYRSFDTRPDHLKHPFLDLIRKSNQPELFKDLYWGELDKNEPQSIICEFEITPSKRPDGRRAPCPMCGVQNKYCKGSLVYFPGRRVVAAIGNECSNDGVTRRAKAEWKQRERVNAEMGILERELPRLPGIMQHLVHLEPVANDMETAMRAFRTSCKPLFGALKSSEKQYVGRLAVRADDGTLQEFGFLSGREFLNTNYKPQRKLAEIERSMRRHVLQDGVDLVEHVLSLDESGTLSATHSEVTSALKDWEKLLRVLRDCRAFFSNKNLDRLKAFAEAQGWPWCDVQYGDTRSHRVLTVRTRDCLKGYVAVSIRRFDYLDKL